MLQEAILKSGELSQLSALINTPTKTEKIREIMREEMEAALNSGNKEKILEAITEKFERKYRNKALSDELKALWTIQKGNPAQQKFKKSIFG